MPGPQLSHLVWTPCKQFAPSLAIVDAKVVPARGGGLESMFPYHLPVPRRAEALSQPVHVLGAQFEHLPLPQSRVHEILPPVSVSPAVPAKMLRASNVQITSEEDIISAIKQPTN